MRKAMASTRHRQTDRQRHQPPRLTQAKMSLLNHGHVVSTVTHGSTPWGLLRILHKPHRLRARGDYIDTIFMLTFCFSSLRNLCQPCQVSLPLLFDLGTSCSRLQPSIVYRGGKSLPWCRGRAERPEKTHQPPDRTFCPRHSTHSCMVGMEEDPWFR